MKLANAVKSHIITNICQRLEIIKHALKAVSFLLRLAQEINTFANLVKSNVNEDNNFVNNDLLTFSQRLELLSYLLKKNRELPNANQMKQIKVRWSKRINTLENIISECGGIGNKISDVFLEAAQIVQDLNVPHIIWNFELTTKDMLTTELK